jgi:hypothetical protein
MEDADGVNHVLRDGPPKLVVDGSEVGSHIGRLADADGSNGLSECQE